MKLVRWKRFTWDLSRLPPPGAETPGRMGVRSAVREEERAVAQVVSRAFSSDAAWGDVQKFFQPLLEAQTEAAFARAPLPIVVMTHGQRIVAASVMTLDPEAENHLLSGPCVLEEYRSRGLGTVLLHHSLLLLKGHGLPRAFGVCKEAAPTSKFVYPKFGSASAEYDFEAGLAAVK